jgi:beta-lactamase regulating signal transducer with metallopeptidase domain
MTLPELLLDSPVVRALGLTLLHALWQGTLLAMVLAPTLGLLSSRSAATRFRVCVVALGAWLAAPLITFFMVLGTEAPAMAAALAPPPMFSSSATPAALTLLERMEPLLPWLVLAWAAGSSALLLRGALGWAHCRHLTRAGTEPAPPALARAVAELCRTLAISRPVRAVLSTRVDVPAVVGWIAPVVLMPLGATDLLTPAQLRAVVAHELAHVARHDHLLALVQVVAEALLFFHPATWWLGSRLRLEREHCCDDVAVSISGNALAYARALSDLEDLAARRQSAGAVLGATALSSQGGSLMSRISRLLGAPAPARRRQTGRVLAGALPAIALGLFSAAALALPNSEPPCDETQACEHCADAAVEVLLVGEDGTELVALAADCDVALACCEDDLLSAAECDVASTGTLLKLSECDELTGGVLLSLSESGLTSAGTLVGLEDCEVSAGTFLLNGIAETDCSLELDCDLSEDGLLTISCDLLASPDEAPCCDTSEECEELIVASDPAATDFYFASDNEVIGLADMGLTGAGGDTFAMVHDPDDHQIWTVSPDGNSFVLKADDGNTFTVESQRGEWVTSGADDTFFVLDWNGDDHVVNSQDGNVFFSTGDGDHQWVDVQGDGVYVITGDGDGGHHVNTQGGDHFFTTKSDGGDHRVESHGGNVFFTTGDDGDNHWVDSQDANVFFTSSGDGGQWVSDSGDNVFIVSGDDDGHWVTSGGDVHLFDDDDHGNVKWVEIASDPHANTFTYAPHAAPQPHPAHDPHPAHEPHAPHAPHSAHDPHAPHAPHAPSATFPSPGHAPRTIVIHGDDDHGRTIKTFRSDDGEEIRVEVIRTDDGHDSQHRVIERIIPRVQRDVRVERLHEDHGDDHGHGHDDGGDHPGLKVLREHLSGWRESGSPRTAPRVERKIAVSRDDVAPRVTLRRFTDGGTSHPPIEVPVRIEVPRLESVRVPSPSHAPRVLIREAIVPDAPLLPRVLMRQPSAPSSVPAPAPSQGRFRIHRTGGEAPAAAPGLMQRVLEGLGVHPAPAALPLPASPASPAQDVVPAVPARPAWPLRLPVAPPAPSPASDDGTIVT